MVKRSQGFWAAYRRFRQEIGLHRLGVTPSTFRGLRDKAAGREVKL
jgi:hypothetical protein